MSTRRAFTSAFIAALVGVHVYAFVVDRDLYYFSRYPMYSWLENSPAANASPVFSKANPPASDRELAYFVLMGVMPDGREKNLIDNAHMMQRNFLPFTKWQIFNVFQVIYKSDAPYEEKQRQIGKALDECAARYEHMRKLHMHPGPPIKALRLYRHVWDDVSISRSGAELLHPDRAELLGEGTVRP